MAYIEKNKRLFFILLLFVIVVGTVWFSISSSTLAARFVWDKYHASSLALALDRTDAQLAFDIGNYSFGYGPYNISLAEQAFQKAVTIDQEILYGHYQLARVLFVEGKLNEAMKEINQELTYHPDNLRALYVRGLIRAYNNDLVDAASDFQQFTEWAPTEWAGYNDLAWVLGQEGKYAQAKAALERGLHLATNADTNPWLWNNLGVQQLNLAEYKDAAVSFQKAKTLAAVLTEKTWNASYPGNNPLGSVDNIKSFQDAIETNLERALSHSKVK